MSEGFDSDVASVRRIEAVPRILEVICRTTGMGFSAVARVTESRWVACAVRDEIAFGLQPGGELVLGTTICDEIRRSGEMVVIEDAEADEIFACHPTPKLYGFRSYISVPLRLPDGRFFGTLCAIDPRPARLKKAETVEMFTLFADLIALHLDSQQRVAASEKALLDERETSQFREQFIAVLGHDLRNPLGAIRTGSDVLALMASGENVAPIHGMIKRSLGRMTGLIDDVLDFARGRLGGGLVLNHREESGLEGILLQVVAELEAAWPGREVRREVTIRRAFACDGARLGQMLSNLLGNALAHGDVSGEVRVTAITTANTFELSVANRGETIPPGVIGQLFQPFFRVSADPGKQGLGLGLYIASEITKAHRGTLEVTSSAGLTCFTFRMAIPDG